jgi:hypothetical protein
VRRLNVPRALALAVAACGFAAGVLALLLAADVGRVEGALAADDARFVSRPLAGGYWEDPGRVPFGAAERLLGLGDDIAHRRAVEAFWISGPRRPLAQRKRRIVERARAQELLGTLETTAPTPEREGQIAHLRGVLALVAAPAEGNRRALILAAADSFRRAIVADPQLDDAKFALEALLRTTSNSQGPGSGEGTGGTRKGGEPGGANLSRPGEGY